MSPQKNWLDELQVGDCVKSVVDEIVGTVIEVGFSAVKVRWDDGLISLIQKRQDVDGVLERVC